MELMVEQKFTQTKVGLIPDEWSKKTLKEVSAFITKGSTPTTYGYNWVSDGILFLRSECVTENGLDLEKSMFISEVAHRTLKRSEIQSHDILMTITGNVGRLVLLDESFGKGNINQHIARIRIISDDIEREYIFNFLNQPTYRKYFESIVTGQAYPQISLTQVREAYIYYPPKKEEQTAIATALSDTDALIAGLEKLIAKKRNIKQGAMQELLRQKEGWVVKQLGHLGKFSKGMGIKKDESLSGDIPCIRYGELYTRHDNYVKHFYSFISKDVATASRRLKKGDLLFAGSGETKEEIGKCAAYIGDTPAYAGSDIVILSPVDVDSLFLGYQLNTPAVNKQKASRGQGDAVVHITANKLSEIQIAIPPSKDEQVAIAQALKEIDAEIESLENKLAKYKKIKQGMMQVLLTGKVRLV